MPASFDSLCSPICFLHFLLSLGQYCVKVCDLVNWERRAVVFRPVKYQFQLGSLC